MMSEANLDEEENKSVNGGMLCSVNCAGYRMKDFV